MTPANAFDSLALEAVRAEMVALGLCRNRINKDFARLKLAFKWSASRKRVPAETYTSLTTVGGLRAWRNGQRNDSETDQDAGRCASAWSRRACASANANPWVWRRNCSHVAASKAGRRLA